MKVDNKQSDEFPVTSGLRQGCVMSPLLFSLYINTLIDTLKKHDCGIQCGNGIIPGLHGSRDVQQSWETLVLGHLGN